MSDVDHLILRRVVRNVLAKTLALTQEKAAEVAMQVDSELRKECGGDRLYVPTADDAALLSRNDRIRRDYEALLKQHGSWVALGILERREALSVRQLQRICIRNG